MVELQIPYLSLSNKHTSLQIQLDFNLFGLNNSIYFREYNCKNPKFYCGTSEKKVYLFVSAQYDLGMTWK